jgi:hypothetical protein
LLKNKEITKEINNEGITKELNYEGISKENLRSHLTKINYSDEMEIKLNEDLYSVYFYLLSKG